MNGIRGENCRSCGGEAKFISVKKMSEYKDTENTRKIKKAQEWMKRNNG
tara:strand:- start:106 stop:252 length:147 start_codon:yes stop_codon:yes gene_type:complete